ncbi:MAG: hypothetical protein IT372_34395 [Polyangiaceae bacterium]|nr:hypothetical protein [Polyangiaceae bacterium]
MHTRTYLRTRWGWEQTALLTGKLPAEAREIFGSPELALHGWYPITVWNAVLDEIARANVRGGPSAVRDVASFIAQEDLTLTHKVLLKLGTPDLVLRQGSTFWRMYFTGGDLFTERLGEKHFKLVLHLGNDPKSDPGRLTCAEAVPGWQENSIRLAGGYGARSNHVKCRFSGHPSCEFDVRWVR